MAKNLIPLKNWVFEDIASVSPNLTLEFFFNNMKRCRISYFSLIFVYFFEIPKNKKILGIEKSI